MADFQGSSTVSNLQARVPGVQVRALQYDPDQFKLNPEIMYRAYNEQRYNPAPRYAAEAAAPVQQPQYGPQEQAFALRGPAAPAAGGGADPGVPYYVRMGGVGASQSMGYRAAQAWEPGAVFAGYMPRGTQAPSPSSATVQPDYASYLTPGPSAHLSPDPTKPTAPVDNPNLRLQAMGLNPW